jgi:galactokinase
MTDTPSIDNLRTGFHSRFGPPDPTLLVCAPGRVNLIGEHIDYNGLSVLPMAIQRHIAVLARRRADAEIHVASLVGGFESCDFMLGADIPAYPVGHWGNYVKAAAQALVREHGTLAGFDAVLDSTIPVASGLSSSSALVIGIALTLLAANDLSTDPIRLAEHMARAERYTGTQGGGMDQAICAGARAGTASRVDFEPLRITPIPIPRDWRFVVAYSLERAEKSGRAQATYNQRTAECREALERVWREVGRDGQDGRAAAGYRELLKRWSVPELLEAAERVLKGALLRRFRHVVTEADRVAHCEAALKAADLATFGRLLNEGQASLRDDYEVSSPALETLTGIAAEAGAAGARLTGAGMGGCMVAVTAPGALGGTLSALADRFYARRAYPGSLEQHLFEAKPSAGATVERL